MSAPGRHQPYGGSGGGGQPPADWTEDAGDSSSAAQAASGAAEYQPWWTSPGGFYSSHAAPMHAAAWYAYYGHSGGRSGDLGTVGGAELAGVDLGDKAARVCRHYARGRCTWGDGCRFSHDMEAAPVLFDGASESGDAAQVGAGQSETAGAQAARDERVRESQSGGNGATARAAYSAFVGEQQQLLMSQRHAVLDAALQAKFQIRAIPQRAPRSADAASEPERGQVILTSLANAPDIVVTLLSDDDVAESLRTLTEDDVRLARGGPLFLVGEASVFWGAMRRWHVGGTTGHADWDAQLARMLEAREDPSAGAADAASTGKPALPKSAVSCLFERLPSSYAGSAGCVCRERCPFAHEDTASKAE